MGDDETERYKMNPVIVIGLHRSGTSVISHLLHAMGVNMGERFREPDQWNKYGYWEDLDFVELNREIFKSCKASWICPPSREMLLDVGKQFESQIAELVESKNVGLWGWKDPRNCLLMPLYEPYLPDHTKYIYVKRNKDSVLNSINKREQEKRHRSFDMSYLSDLYDRYTQDADDYLWRNTHYTKPFHIVSYDALLEHPDYIIERLAEFLHLGKALEKCRGIVRSSA